MPYEIRWNSNGACKRFFGHVTAAEFMRSIAETQNHPDYDRFRYTLNDFLAVTSFDVNKADVIQYVAYALGAQFSNKKIVVAIVATSEAILDLIKGYYEPLARYEMGYFDTSDAATQWLQSRVGGSVAV